MYFKIPYHYLLWKYLKKNKENIYFAEPGPRPVFELANSKIKSNHVSSVTASSFHGSLESLTTNNIPVYLGFEPRSIIINNDTPIWDSKLHASSRRIKKFVFYITYSELSHCTLRS